MLFSIVVPIYKVEKYLERCVDSLMNQTFTDIEIILVDDGSPDKCPKMCDDFSKKDNRIKVIHKVNGGLSDARNAGIRVAKGQYIIFVDSDDYIELDACEKLAIYTKEKNDVIVCNAIVEGATINLSHISPGKNIYSGIEYLNKAFSEKKAPMAAWLNIYRTEYLTTNSLYFKYGIFHEDEEFTPKVLMKAEKVIVTDVLFYHYVVRDGSITTKKDQRKNAEDLFETCCELEKIYNSDIQNNRLKRMMLDSLVQKYLSLFQSAKLYHYGKEYYHKRFMIRNSFAVKTKMKVVLYTISPYIYFWMNRTIKKNQS